MGYVDGFIDGFNMYENLFSPSGGAVSADMMVNDSINLPYKAPFLGEEWLNLILSSKSLKSEDTQLSPGPLYQTSITDRHLTKDRQQIYLLHFTSELDMIQSNTSISEAFRGQEIHKIVGKILDDYCWDNDNEQVIEATIGVENIVIPNWKPFKALNWLAKRAVNKAGVPNFLFWESNGITYFKSVDSLMQQESKYEFIFSPVVGSNQVMEDLAKGKMHVSHMEILNQYNVVRNTNKGYYASKLITHDIVKKEIKQQTYGLNMAFDPHVSHTDDFMPLSADTTWYNPNQPSNSFAPQPMEDGAPEGTMQSYYDANVMFYPKHDRMYSKSKTDEYDNNVEDWKLKRNALILGLDQIKLRLTFPGISNIRVGYKIHLVVPSPEKVIESKPGQVENKEDLYDHFLSGEYLITALKHTVAKRNDGKFDYTMMVDCIKDALREPPTYHKGQ